MNEPEENKYVRELRTKNLELTAENLLHVMRPPMEDILQMWIPEQQAPSQSHRAMKLLDKLEEQIKAAKTMEESAPLFRVRRTIRDFLAVNRTVYILDGRPVV